MASEDLISLRCLLRRTLICLKFVMTPSTKHPELHRFLFHPPSRFPRLWSLEQGISDFTTMHTSALRTLLIKKATLYKHREHPFHEFIWVDVIDAEAQGWAGILVLELRRNEVSRSSTPDNTEAVPAQAAAQQTLEMFELTPTAQGELSPTSVPTPTSVPSQIVADSGESGIKADSGGSGRYPRWEDATNPMSGIGYRMILGLPQPTLLEIRAISKAIYVWKPDASLHASLAPHKRPSAFLRILAAATVVSSAPKDTLLHHQSFYFAGVLLALIAGEKPLRDGMGKANKNAGSPLTIPDQSVKECLDKASELQPRYKDELEQMILFVDDICAQHEEAKVQAAGAKAWREHRQAEARIEQAEAKAREAVAMAAKERQEREHMAEELKSLRRKLMELEAKNYIYKQSAKQRIRPVSSLWSSSC